MDLLYSLPGGGRHEQGRHVSSCPAVSSAPIVVVHGGDVRPDDRARIRAAAPAADVRFPADQAELDRQVADAEVIAGAIGPTALARAARLRWLHSWIAGVDGLLFPELIASPVTVTNVRGNGAVPLAEHAIWLMLTLNRRALRWIDNQRAHRWQRFVDAGELQGLTCGIVGLGLAGQDLALKCKAFHMRVLGVRRQPTPTPNVDELFGPDRLREMLPRCDFVVVAAPRTPETRGMLGEAELRLMKPTACYVCFSRGGIADDAALLRALREGWIAGAGLDAHGQEPLPPDSPFWDLPNVVITPHNAASSRAVRQRGIDIFVENLRRYVADQPLLNVVDKQLGY
jgi:phosphoglycerate dehydrogenase-like enzyme